ncbi:MAG: L,D-transpeptidase family protein [bacterium]
MQRRITHALEWLAFSLVTLLALSGCTSSVRVSGDSRIGVYSTSYLTEDNQIAYASHTASKPELKPRTDWSWNGDGITGAPSIEINLTKQEAVFSKGGLAVGRSHISSGREGYGTPTGVFSITQKNKNHVSNLYGDYVDAEGKIVVANVACNRDPRPAGTTFRGAPMPYFMRFCGGIGMHAGHLPGYPASHGCIRMPREAAQRFFENAPLGTPVRVLR